MCRTSKDTCSGNLKRITCDCDKNDQITVQFCKSINKEVVSKCSTLHTRWVTHINNNLCTE